ncbi:MAG: trigger factor [bacterium]|nr:trigger factor [bacterium]
MELIVENKRLSEVQAELIVAVPAEYMTAEVERKLASVAAHADVPGFRRGKIPRNILLQKYGPAITEDTVQTVLQEAYRTALEQEKLFPVTPGEMSEINFEPGQPLTFKVIVELLPDITVPELSEISVELKDPQADDEDINTALDSLREGQAVLVPSDDPVDQHSVVTFDLQELDDSGVPMIGRSQKGVTVDMSRQSLGEEFASKMTGLTNDQTTTVTFHRGEGQSLRTQITIRNVQRKELPEVDDQFVQSVNPNLTSLDDLRSDLRRYIESRAGHAARQQMFRTLADELLRRSEFQVPPRMLDNYLDRMADEAVHNSKGHHDDHAMAEFREKYRASAIWTLRWYLMRNRLIQLFDLRATEDDVNEELARLATLEDEMLDDFRKRLTPDQIQQVHDDIQERKVFDYLEAQVQLQKTPISLAEFEGRTEPSKIITV